MWELILLIVGGFLLLWLAAVDWKEKPFLAYTIFVIGIILIFVAASIFFDLFDKLMTFINKFFPLF
jgi:hypothetical protein